MPNDLKLSIRVLQNSLSVPHCGAGSLPAMPFGACYRRRRQASSMPHMNFAEPCVLIFFLCGLIHVANTDAEIINAASCSHEDVQKAIDAAGDGDIVLVPAGSSAWTAPVTIGKIVSWNPPLTEGKQITLQGAGIDETIITDQIPKGSPNDVPLKSHSQEGKPFRITGFTFRGGATKKGWNGTIAVGGTCKNWRIDHIKFENLKTSGIRTYGHTYGVIDHCTFNLTGTQPIVVWHSGWNGRSYGDGSWADGLYLGTEKAVYIEDNTFTFTRPMGAVDSMGGGRYVFRHNTVRNGNIGNHGTESSGRIRSCRSYEIYGNTFTYTLSSPVSKWWTAVFLRGGTGVIYDNTFTGYNSGVIVKNYRDFHAFKLWGAADGTSPYDVNDGVTYDSGEHTGDNGQRVLTSSGKTWKPGQWVGYSLHNTTKGKSSMIVSNTENTITTIADPYAASLAWDKGDSFTILKAYPCIDQVGRSTGKLLSNHDPPLPQEWPEQALEPLFEWNNTLSGGDADIGSGTPHIQEGRDFYNDTPRPGYKPYTYPHPLTQQFPPLPRTDLEAPTAPQNLTARAVSEGRVELNWEAPADNEGIMGYYVWRDGKKLTAVTDPGYTRCIVRGLKLSSMQYTFTVSAFDAAGNESKQSAPAAVSQR